MHFLYYKIIRAPKKFKSGCVPYLGLELTMHVLNILSYISSWVFFVAVSIYIFFGGVECVGLLLCLRRPLLRDVWIRTQKASVAIVQTTNLATHLSTNLATHSKGDVCTHHSRHSQPSLIGCSVSLQRDLPGGPGFEFFGPA